jgi:4-amino-4-deoxy-L-arabinose transferase-like glycosyltransferase
MTATLDESATYPLQAAEQSRGAVAVVALRRLARATPWPICAITALAAALRFAQLDLVAPNQFYDAAVRSMSASWHNFFFGAFDPGGILSIDKPPLDLWLEVASVKLLGWGQVALRLPEVLGGTLAVPLLYDTVRRVAGRPAGLAGAAALAVLPESVLTARSDTMDSLMMLFVVGALWAVVRACDAYGSGRRMLMLAGVLLGVAFNVKLIEALVIVPALVVLYLLSASGTRATKVKDLIASGLAMVTVGLAWAVIASLAPGRHPWPVGSSDGTVWNAMFVFNGFGKVSGATQSTKPGGPGPFRLLVSTGWHFDELFGCVLVAAIAIGTAAAVQASGRAGRSRTPACLTALPGAFAIALAVWIAFAVLVFETMNTLHARYLEALAPALAATIGYGAASLAGLTGPRTGTGARRPSVLAVVAALIVICAYTFHFTPRSLGSGATALILAAVGAALIARASTERASTGPNWLLMVLIVACALVFPVHETVALVRSGANDSGGLAVTPAVTTTALSRYLAPRTVGARYELAVDEPLQLAPLVIQDQRPILPLTSFGGQRLIGLGQLLRDVRAGSVRYGLVGSYHCGPANVHWAACGPAAQWIRQHGTDVSSEAGLVGPSRLYRLG